MASYRRRKAVVEAENNVCTHRKISCSYSFHLSWELQVGCPYNAVFKIFCIRFKLNCISFSTEYYFNLEP